MEKLKNIIEMEKLNLKVIIQMEKKMENLKSILKMVKLNLKKNI